MEAIRQWVFALCSAAVACSLLQMLAPKSGTYKVFRIAVSVFFLCCMFSPIILPDESYEFDLRSENSISKAEEIAAKLKRSLGEQTEFAVQENIAQEIATELKTINVQCKKITVKNNTLANGSIEIYGAALEIAKEYSEREKEITELIGKKYGFSVIISFT